MAVYVQFLNAPEGRTSEHGPFDFVQLTYADLRVGPDGDYYAAYEEGHWRVLTRGKGGKLKALPQKWTDVVLASEPFK